MSTIYQGDIVLLKRLPNKRKEYPEFYDGWYMLLRDQESKDQMYFKIENASIKVQPCEVSRDPSSIYMVDKYFTILNRIYGSDALGLLNYNFFEEKLRELTLKRTVEPLQKGVIELERYVADLQNQINDKKQQISQILENGIPEYKYRYVKGVFRQGEKEYMWRVPDEMKDMFLVEGMTVTVESRGNSRDKVTVTQVIDSNELLNHKYILGISSY